MEEKCRFVSTAAISDGSSLSNFLKTLSKIFSFVKKQKFVNCKIRKIFQHLSKWSQLGCTCLNCGHFYFQRNVWVNFFFTFFRWKRFLIKIYNFKLKSPMGIPMAMIEAKKREILNREQNKNKISQMAKKLDQKVSQVNGMNSK